MHEKFNGPLLSVEDSRLKVKMTLESFHWLTGANGLEKRDKDIYENTNNVVDANVLSHLTDEYKPEKVVLL